MHFAGKNIKMSMSTERKIIFLRTRRTDFVCGKTFVDLSEQRQLVLIFRAEVCKVRVGE